MKRHILASYVPNEREHFVYERSGDRYSVDIFRGAAAKHYRGGDGPVIYISAIHPYDMADYCWARITPPVIRYWTAQGHKAAPEYRLDFVADNYEDEDEYLRELIDVAALTLTKLNANVEPRIDHT